MRLAALAHSKTLIAEELAFCMLCQLCTYFVCVKRGAVILAAYEDACFTAWFSGNILGIFYYIIHSSERLIRFKVVSNTSLILKIVHSIRSIPALCFNSFGVPWYMAPSATELINNVPS